MRFYMILVYQFQENFTTVFANLSKIKKNYLSFFILIVLIFYNKAPLTTILVIKGAL